MTPEELADLAHLRRARELVGRDHAQPLDVPTMARTALMSPGRSSREDRAAYGEMTSQHRARDHRDHQVRPSCGSTFAARPRRRPVAV